MAAEQRPAGRSSTMVGNYSVDWVVLQGLQIFIRMWYHCLLAVLKDILKKCNLKQLMLIFDSYENHEIESLC